MSMTLCRVLWVACLVLLANVAAEPIFTPANWTAGARDNGTNVRLILWQQGNSTSPTHSFDLLPIAPGAADDKNSPPGGLRGGIIVADTNNSLQVNSNDISLISCDPYPGILQAGDVFEHAASQSTIAGVFFSQTSDYCNVTNNVAKFIQLYSLKSPNDTTSVLAAIQTLGSGNSSLVSAVIDLDADKHNGTMPNSIGTGNGSDQRQNPLGSSPSTAVAMIILYSITGIITALFLIIIITGAVRAHRHPERYGPRRGIGRPRQSRARGLARAMLDSLPIVKVGEREDPKPTDVELANGSEGRQASAPQNQEAREREPLASSASAARGTSPARSHEAAAADTAPATEGGIAPAVAQESHPDTQGCSICTEDFEPGQDQRVLPCDHRFHPDCIDPWLLNVSGTCPLCRIDLRPTTSRTSASGGGAEDDFAPPLDSEGAPRRMSVRRSIIFGLMGVRPERLSREERVRALREMRGQQLAARNRQSQALSVGAQQEEERSLRRRLRNAFRVRTRRTGEEEEEGEAPPPPAVPASLIVYPGEEEGVETFMPIEGTTNGRRR